MTQNHRSSGERSARAGAESAAAWRTEATGETVSRESVLHTYRRYAPVYDWIFGKVLDQGRRELGARVSALDPARILEVGVGTGLTLKHYPARAAFTGIDLSEQMLSHARRRAAAMPTREIGLLCMDAERMSFEDAAFDCVTMPYVLSVTPDPDALVAEVRRVCRPDGHIVLLNHFSGARWFHWGERLARAFADQLGFRSDFDFERHVGRYDWSVESVHATNLLGLSKVVVIRNAS